MRFLFSLLDLRPIQGVNAGTTQLQALINAFLAASGAIAALIIVVAGVRYIFSRGDPGEVATSRNAIIYASIGLVVIISAYGIVNFVILGVSR